MRYLFDIGHPAEFHYFKLTMEGLRAKGHDILITARDKDVCLELLAGSGFEYISTGRNVKSWPGKALTLFRNDVKIWSVARKFQPDLVVNFLSPFAAHAARLLGVPVIGFHDTESAGLSVGLATPFTDAVVLPESYSRRISVRKEVRFRGYFPLNYLSPKYFTPDGAVLKRMGLGPGDRFMLCRFVSHRALHDIGDSGLSLDTKRAAVEEFSKSARVFVSSEVSLPPDLQRHRLDIPAELIHHVLFHADLVWGDSATMSAEGAVLGTPSVYVDRRGRGYTFDLERKYGLLFNFPDDAENQKRAVEKGVDILTGHRDAAFWDNQRGKLLDDAIDSAAFMTWLIENYPQSVETMKREPDTQERFRG
jgi:predicted glycosyltransferase